MNLVKLPAQSDAVSASPAFGLVNEEVTAERLTRFVHEGVVLLAELDKGLTLADAKQATHEVIVSMGRRFHALACAAELLNLGAVQETAQLAEKLIDLDRRGQNPMTLAEADVLRHAVDVLSLQIHDIRRRLEGYPAANVRIAAVALRDRMRHALKAQTSRS
jgi:chemotaxis protein histidine kinase CheA